MRTSDWALWTGRACRVGVAFLLVWAAGSTGARAQQESDTSDAGPPPTSDRAIVNADSLSALEQDGERLQELFDNVKVRQDTTRLESNFGLRYLDRDELLFTGDVVIYERGDTLRADTVLYDKRTKVGYARSNVRLTDGKVLVRAPRAIYYTEEKRSVFPDTVTLEDSTSVLRAGAGTYWSNERRAEFQGNVHLTDPETDLQSDSLTYYRDRDRSIAKGQVFIRRIGEDEEAPADTTARTYLFGDWADNQEQNRYSLVRGDALLVRVRMDSTGTPDDTLVVRGRQLEAFRTDTHRRMIAVDSVRIWERDLSAVADSTVYDRVLAAGPPDSLATPSPFPGPSAPVPPGGMPDAPTGPDSTRAPSDAGETGPPSAPTDTSEAPDPSPADTAAAPTVPADSSAENGAIPSDSTGAPDTAQAAPPAVSTDSALADTMTPPVPTVADTTTPPDSVRADTMRADTTRADTTAADSTAPAQATARADTTAAPQDAGSAQAALPVVDTTEQVPLEETRLFRAPVTWFERSQVWGDSIRVRARERTLDTVFVRQNAFAAQRDSTLDRIQQLKGRDITAFFRADSLRRITAEPNALAIRFLKTDAGTLKGAAKVSGDRIVLRFRKGEVKRTSVIGGVQSTYYRSPSAVPTPFHLQGFQWTPERKPTKDGLLGQQRVRKRLGLPPYETAVPIAQQRTTDASADTTQDVPSSDQEPSLLETRRSQAPSASPPQPDSLKIPADTLDRGRPSPRTP